jgi:hypothetical protein
MKTLREYIDQLNEISRRDFLKGMGATAGTAALGAPKTAAAFSYALDDTDYQTLLFGCMAVGFKVAMYKPFYNLLTDIYGFMGLDANAEIQKRFQSVTANVDPNKQEQVKQLFNDRQNVINLLNKLEKLKTNIIMSMSSEERRYHMNRLGIKEAEVDEAATPDAVERIEQLVQYK